MNLQWLLMPAELTFQTKFSTFYVISGYVMEDFVGLTSKSISFLNQKFHILKVACALSNNSLSTFTIEF